MKNIDSQIEKRISEVVQQSENTTGKPVDNAELLWSKLDKKLRTPQKTKRISLKTFLAAASILLIIASGIWTFSTKERLQNDSMVNNNVANNIDNISINDSTRYKLPEQNANSPKMSEKNKLEDKIICYVNEFTNE